MKRRNKDLEATIRDTVLGLEAILDKVHSGELEAASSLEANMVRRMEGALMALGGTTFQVRAYVMTDRYGL